MKKRREHQSSELMKIFAKKFGFEDKLIALEVKDFLADYLDRNLYNEIKSVDLKNKTLIIKINSPLLKNDFKMKKSFYLKKFQQKFGDDLFHDLIIF